MSQSKKITVTTHYRDKDAVVEKNVEPIRKVKTRATRTTDGRILTFKDISDIIRKKRDENS